MPIDPSSVIGYSLMGAGSGLVTRIMQHLLPTPLEKAQTENIHANLALARERLEREEERVRAEWDVRRELQLKQIDASQSLEYDRELMRRWPLEVPAPAFVRYSRGHSHGALNVIVWPRARRTLDMDVDQINKAMGELFFVADALVDLMPRLFGDRIIYYRETDRLRPAERPKLVGQQLEAVLYGMTATEPTLLLQLSFLDATALRLSFSCWGWSGDPAVPLSGSLIARAHGPMTVKDIERAILATICALYDQYHLVQTLSHAEPPKFLTLPHGGGNLTFEDDRVPSAPRPLSQMLELSYRGALESVGATQPELAAEAAARAALAARAASNEPLSESFLDLALDFYRRDSATAARGRDVVAQIMRPSPVEPQPFIRTALRDIRKLDPSDYRELSPKMSFEDAIASIVEFEKEMDPETRERMRAKIREMLTYVPKIGVFGKAGVGKSSLCNALFGRKMFEVSDVEACTREPQILVLDIGNSKEMQLLDVPGLGESVLRDEEYRKLYKSLLPSLDALIWVLRADERAYAVDQSFYLSTVKQYIKQGQPFLIVLNQVDVIQPHKEWSHGPGPTQADNIRRKYDAVASLFQLDKGQIVAVSSTEKYGLQALLDKLLLSLPPAKRVGVYNSASDEARSEEAAETVREGIKTELNGVAMGVGAAIGAILGTIILPGAGTVIGAGIGAAAGRYLNKVRAFFS